MKDVIVCLEHRFFQFDDGLYTKLSFPYSYWSDYLSYFSSVKIVARVLKVDSLEPGMARVDGPSVSFIPLPYYVGPKQFLLRLPALLWAIYYVARMNRYFILRSGNSSNILWIYLMLLNKTYLREYPGNVKEGVLGFGGNSFKMRLLANFLDALARLQGKHSKSNSFVSEYCRGLYGSAKPGVVFSSFKASEISAQKNSFSLIHGEYNLVAVGRLEPEKGHQVLLNAIKASSNVSCIKLHIVGDGGRRAELESKASSLGLNVVFHGAVTDRQRLFAILAASDLFIIPSLTEGMPRALLEAMTVGVPCLGTRVGGIPEVLPDAYLCPPGDPEGLAMLIDKFLASELLRTEASNRGRELIGNLFCDEVLRKQKISFWSSLYE